jgi:hypothetical protein
MRNLNNNEFAHKNNDKLQPKCKLCQRAYAKNHYYEHKNEYIDRKNLRKLIFQESITDIIITRKSVPCTDCKKEFHHSAMTFDHLHDKIANIADFTKFTVSQKSIDLLELELKKCDVVCANCHQIREWNRVGHTYRPNRIKRIEALKIKVDNSKR